MPPKSPRHGRTRRTAPVFAGAAASLLCLGAARTPAQSCTTQARMTAQQREQVGTAALDLARAVQAGDVAKVRLASTADGGGDGTEAAYLVRSTGEHLRGDSLAVTQLYLLDATNRRAGDSSEADFSCALTGTVSETDFGITGLPPGRFAFAMVEATGPSPWLLSFLLQADGSAWKMAGFYPHARTAAGHDGLWYWTTARADAKANKPWLAWMYYQEADQLLRPANFVGTGNLDKLRGEQRTAAPQALTNGLSAQAPLALQGPGGTVYQVSELRSQSSDDGRSLNLVMHVESPSTAATEAVTERNLAAGRALLAAHPELRQAFANIWIVADRSGADPILTQRPIDQLGTAAQ